ncbi:MAG: hypothetical protein WCD83_18800, partial [Pseudolabrys sp.]
WMAPAPPLECHELLWCNQDWGEPSMQVVTTVGLDIAGRGSSRRSASIGQTRDRTRPMLQQRQKVLAEGPPHVTQSGHARA